MHTSTGLPHASELHFRYDCPTPGGLLGWKAHTERITVLCKNNETVCLDNF